MILPFPPERKKRKCPRPTLTDEQRIPLFWAKVRKDGPVPQHAPHLGECWLWTGARTQQGYGSFLFARKKQVASRVAFFLANGRWPEPCCLHLCDGGALGCVRPDHLKEGTQLDNVADRDAKGRQRAPKGEACNLAKFTEAQVLEMRSLYADGMSQRALAKRFGTHESVIWAITSRRTWKHVGGPYRRKGRGAVPDGSEPPVALSDPLRSVPATGDSAPSGRVRRHSEHQL